MGWMCCSFSMRAIVAHSACPHAHAAQLRTACCATALHAHSSRLAFAPLVRPRPPAPARPFARPPTLAPTLRPLAVRPPAARLPLTQLPTAQSPTARLPLTQPPAVRLPTARLSSIRLPAVRLTPGFRPSDPRPSGSRPSNCWPLFCFEKREIFLSWSKSGQVGEMARRFSHMKKRDLGFY